MDPGSWWSDVEEAVRNRSLFDVVQDLRMEAEKRKTENAELTMENAELRIVIATIFNSELISEDEKTALKTALVDEITRTREERGGGGTGT